MSYCIRCNRIARVEVRRVTDEEGDMVGDPARYTRIIYQTEHAGNYCEEHANELCRNPEYVLGEEL